MKTKIIYISGDEIFNINDIRNAFEAVRNALQLDKDTVLFGVPVDKEDAGFATDQTPCEIELQQDTPQSQEIEITETVIENNDENIEPVIIEEPEKNKTKRGRSRKKTEPENTEEPEKIVPILSVLSTNDEDDSDVVEQTDATEPETEIVDEIVSEEDIEIVDTDDKQNTENDVITEIDNEPETENYGEPDLEKLLSAMTPLQEDILEEKKDENEISITDTETNEDVDATLEQLATEFAEAQDKIATETKSSTRSRIGKLRNILPFKQSKHQDQGLGDLFGWAGVAANDEEFSVPGFFTNAASKK